MRKFKLTLAVVLVILLVSILPLNLFSREKYFSIPKECFSTPESAISYFLNALKENDLSKAFTACAIDEYSQGLDFNAYCTGINAINFISGPAPSGYPLYSELNKIEKMANLSRKIKIFCYSILSTEKKDYYVVQSPTEKRLSAFIDSSDPAGLSELEIVSIDKPDILESDQHKANEIRKIKCFGADDGTDRIVLFKIKGESGFYFIGFHLLKYGESWKIDDFSSYISIFGEVKKIEVSEYLQFVE